MMSSYFNIKHGLCGLAVFWGMTFSLMVHAGTKTQTMNPNTNVSNVCQVQSTDNIGLGNYNPASGLSLQGLGHVKLICTKKAAVSVIPQSGGSTLTGGAGNLTYGLYVDSALTQKWGSPTYTRASWNPQTGGTYTYFKYTVTVYNVNATIQDIQAAAPNFDPNTMYYVYHQPNGTTPYTKVTYGYMLQSNTLSSFGSADHWYSAYPLYLVDNPTLNSIPYGYVLPTNTPVSSGTYQVPVSASGPASSLNATSTSALSVTDLVYYAKVSNGQDVPPGTYIDTVVLQVSF